MTARKIKLADVLWRAANTELHADDETRRNTCMHSCNAFRWAVRHIVRSNFTSLDRPTFLHDLGAPNGSGYFPEGVDEQGCRYMFLLLAMHVAEDEGIELGVEA